LHAHATVSGQNLPTCNAHHSIANVYIRVSGDFGLYDRANNCVGLLEACRAGHVLHAHATVSGQSLLNCNAHHSIVNVFIRVSGDFGLYDRANNCVGLLEACRADMSYTLTLQSRDNVFSIAMRTIPLQTCIYALQEILVFTTELIIVLAS
jgi:hypothetical protein